MVMNRKNNSRWSVLLTLILVVCCIILNSCGKKTQKSKVYHVGILSGLDFFTKITDGFKSRMTKLGYVEGKNIVYDFQKTNFDMAAYESILKKFVADKVDLIFTFPTESALVAKAVTKGTNIPVLFACSFMEDTNLINSVQEPGENITGVRFPGPDIALKRFEIMHEFIPGAKRMWVPYQKGYPSITSQFAMLNPAAAAAGVTLIEVPASDAKELEAEFQKHANSVNSETDVVLVIAEPFCVTPDSYRGISKFADVQKIPVGGALMSIGGYETIFGLNPQIIPQGRQAAFLADKILKGTPAGTIPVVSAEGYFQINYKSAKKFGLKVPEGLLSRADKIIR